MGTVDEDAREYAWKALLVTTIVLTILWNIALMYKIINAAGSLTAVLTGPRGPRYQTLVSLVVGDVFVAMFSLVIEVILLFEDNTSVKCRSVLLGRIYLRYIMPFVYGVGIVVLTAECAFFRRRMRRTSSSENPGALMSLAVSVLPWILGITIALPLNIADEDIEKCQLIYSLNRARTIVWVCQVLPVAMAVFFTTLNICCRQNQSPASVGNQPEPAAAFTSFLGQQNATGAAPTAQQQPTAPPYEEEHGVFAEPHPGVSVLPPTMVSYQPTNSSYQQYQSPNLNISQQPQYGGFLFHGQPQHAHHHHHMVNGIRTQPTGAQFFQSQPPPYGPYPGHGQSLPAGSVTYTPSGQPSLLPPPPSLRLFYSLREKRALAMASLVLFVCVAPFAIFQLSYVYNEDRENLKTLSRTIISDLVFWLMAVRSFVTPFFWVMTGSFKMSGSR
ncbi:hypothetical protein ElyMa_006037700 [Elysia marginata]|uniref:G-protein coupled receptors family 1 profile domain-containing protein n=1 Tax=Elysia marginata TaxID=1093978 RepID=A0AAV4GJA4_9GAST|nr:hypothetical protein ElyMa_006037700 [Elysia marginata]